MSPNWDKLWGPQRFQSSEVCSIFVMTLTFSVNILYFLYYEINIIQQGRHDPKKDKFTERPGGELAIEMLFAVLTPNFMLAYGIIKLYVKSGIMDLCENQVPGSLNRVLVNAFGDTEENNNYFTDPDSYCNYDLRLLNGERKFEEWPALRGAFLCCWDPPGIESSKLLQILCNLHDCLPWDALHSVSRELGCPKLPGVRLLTQFVELNFAFVFSWFNCISLTADWIASAL